MKMIKITLSALFIVACIQISAENSSIFEFQNKIDLDRVLAKVSRTDQDYSDKYFTGLSFNYDPNKNLENKDGNEENYYPDQNDDPYNQHHLAQGYYSDTYHNSSYAQWTPQQINHYYAQYGYQNPGYSDYQNQSYAHWTPQQISRYYAHYGYSSHHNQAYAQGTSQQMNQIYTDHSNYSQNPRDVNSNKQMEAADWAEQMRAEKNGYSKPPQVIAY